MVSNDCITLQAMDCTGQRRTSYEVPRGSTVNDLIEGLEQRMGLMRSDSDGRDIVWYARHERLGRTLHRTEVVGDSLADQDSIRLQPEISAGMA